MHNPILEVNGQTTCLRYLELTARLDRGSKATAVPWGRLPGIQVGQEVRVSVDGTAFEMVVAPGFYLPHAGGGHLPLIDRIAAAAPFNGEAFSDANQDTGLDRVLAARIPVGGTDALAADKYPAILAHDIALADVLRDIAARHDWHFYWQGGRVVVGPLPQAAPVEFEAAGWADTDQGPAIRVHGKLPPLGSPVRVAKTEGNLLGILVHAEDGAVPVQEIVVGSPRSCTRPPFRATTFLRARVEKLEPLFVRAALPDGRQAALPAELFSLKSDRGRCRFAFRLAVGDRVQLAWPLGFFTGLPWLLPIDHVPPAAQFEMHAEAALASWKRWDAVAHKIDFSVNEEMNIHD